MVPAEEVVDMICGVVLIFPEVVRVVEIFWVCFVVAVVVDGFIVAFVVVTFVVPFVVVALVVVVAFVVVAFVVVGNVVVVKIG